MLLRPPSSSSSLLRLLRLLSTNALHTSISVSPSPPNTLLSLHSSNAVFTFFQLRLRVQRGKPFARTNRSISNTLELTEGHPPTSVVVRRLSSSSVLLASSEFFFLLVVVASTFPAAGEGERPPREDLVVTIFNIKKSRLKSVETVVLSRFSAFCFCSSVRLLRKTRFACCCVYFL